METTIASGLILLLTEVFKKLNQPEAEKLIIEWKEKKLKIIEEDLRYPDSDDGLIVLLEKEIKNIEQSLLMLAQSSSGVK